jgi:hypothetical protein
MFAMVEGTKVSGSGNYFPNVTARYMVRVTECKGTKSRKGVPAFIVEVEVLQLLMQPSASVDGEGRTVPTPGDRRSWYVNLSIDAGPPDMMRFVALVLGIDDPEDVTEANCEGVVDIDIQPCVGLELVLYTYNKQTQKGNPFTRHEWSLPAAPAAPAAPVVE